MDLGTVSVANNGAIGVLTLNQPGVMNALNDQLIKDLTQAIKIISDDDQVRALIITGGDKVFAAGGDIKAMLECGPWEAKKYVIPIHKVFNLIMELSKPTIAAISGFALGGGLELALTCDFRIAAENARFGFPEINLGIFPGAGGSQRLPRLIGMSKAKDLMFTGDTIDADTALSIGLIDNVVAREELMESSLQLARKLAAKPPMALSSLKESMHNVLNLDLKMGLELEIEILTSLFATEDQKEGMRAFMEKRKPAFMGK